MCSLYWQKGKLLEQKTFNLSVTFSKYLSPFVGLLARFKLIFFIHLLLTAEIQYLLKSLNKKLLISNTVILRVLSSSFLCAHCYLSPNIHHVQFFLFFLKKNKYLLLQEIFVCWTIGPFQKAGLMKIQSKLTCSLAGFVPVTQTFSSLTYPSN